MHLDLVRTTDILETIGERKRHGQVLVGFAAETQNMDHHARQKLKAKHLDLIAANLIGPPDSGFGADTNRMTLYFDDDRKIALDVMDKHAVAHCILDHVAGLLHGDIQS